MDRGEIVLAAIAAGGKGSRFPPAQAQKLLFLIDEEVAEGIGGKKFDFQPYDYGPFDSEVYRCLEGLSNRGQVKIAEGGPYRHYSLTDEGYEQGAKILENLPADVREFIEAAAAWVNSLRFEQLVSAIYQRYPEMKARSIFRT